MLQKMIRRCILQGMETIIERKPRKPPSDAFTDWLCGLLTDREFSEQVRASEITSITAPVREPRRQEVA